MAGREKIKLYQYSSEGKYIGSIECMADVHRKYYKGAHHPIFRKWTANERYEEADYHELPDGTFIAKFRIGRDKLLQLVRIDKDPFTRKDEGTFPIVVFSISGRELATFDSVAVAEKLLGRRINHRIDRKYLKSDDNLIFKSKK